MIISEKGVLGQDQEPPQTFLTRISPSKRGKFTSILVTLIAHGNLQRKAVRRVVSALKNSKRPSLRYSYVCDNKGPHKTYCVIYLGSSTDYGMGSLFKRLLKLSVRKKD